MVLLEKVNMKNIQVHNNNVNILIYLKMIDYLLIICYHQLEHMKDLLILFSKYNKKFTKMVQ